MYHLAVTLTKRCVYGSTSIQYTPTCLSLSLSNYKLGPAPMEAQGFATIFPRRLGTSTQMRDDRRLPVSSEDTGGTGHMLILVAVGGDLVLLADLLELGLDDLDDLGFVQIGLGNADVQRSHLDELPV